jgi:hypothetical protein
MFDLSKNNPADVAEAGYEFKVMLPDGTETDIKIKVRGVHSPVVKAFGREVLKEMKMKEEAAKRRNKLPEDMTIEEAEDFAVRAAIVRTISWQNIGEDGQEIPFTKENAQRIYLKYPWIREQVMEQSNDVFNFRHSGD